MFKRIRNRQSNLLTECAVCDADFVHPLEWHPQDEEHWWMLLRCGGCGARREETVANATMRRPFLWIMLGVLHLSALVAPARTTLRNGRGPRDDWLAPTKEKAHV